MELNELEKVVELPVAQISVMNVFPIPSNFCSHRSKPVKYDVSSTVSYATGVLDVGCERQSLG